MDTYIEGNIYWPKNNRKEHDVINAAGFMVQTVIIRVMRFVASGGYE